MGNISTDVSKCGRASRNPEGENPTDSSHYGLATQAIVPKKPLFARESRISYRPGSYGVPDKPDGQILKRSKPEATSSEGKPRAKNQPPLPDSAEKQEARKKPPKRGVQSLSVARRESRTRQNVNRILGAWAPAFNISFF